jgi:hypothetical protein
MIRVNPRHWRILGRWGVTFSLAASLLGGTCLVTAVTLKGKPLLAAQKSAQKKTKKGAAAKDAMAAPGDTTPAATTAPAGDGTLSFKRDIAPILVANCIGCHSGTGRGMTVGKYDQSTFEKLMAGGKSGKDIIAGDPDSSHLVLRVKGEETPKMPPGGGQRGFSDEAAAKLETWVKQGARLDAGISATDPIAKYAASIEDLRKAELAKLKPEERDKVAETAGLERWKKATTKVTPEVTSSAHFLLLSNLSKERSTKLLKTMESQYTLANRVLSTGRTPVLSTTEKYGLYVFKDRNTFVEFVRANEQQEVEADELGRAKLTVESPYLVAIDPAGGAEESAPAPAKKARGKRSAEDSLGGPERSLAGVLTEQLVVAAANAAGKPPRWVSLGLGAFFASKLEGGSPYYRRLRAEVGESIRIGWIPKANEALGGEAKIENQRAIGFGLFEWMSAGWAANNLTNFVHVMLEGQGKLDEAIGNCLDLNREQFLNQSGEWFVERYGSR